jgi:hypothetical protein
MHICHSNPAIPDCFFHLYTSASATGPIIAPITTYFTTTSTMAQPNSQYDFTARLDDQTAYEQLKGYIDRKQGQWLMLNHLEKILQLLKEKAPNDEVTENLVHHWIKIHKQADKHKGDGGWQNIEAQPAADCKTAKTRLETIAE